MVIFYVESKHDLSLLVGFTMHLELPSGRDLRTAMLALRGPRESAVMSAVKTQELLKACARTAENAA